MSPAGACRRAIEGRMHDPLRSVSSVAHPSSGASAAAAALPQYPEYPAGTVRALLDTALVTAPTKRVLTARLQALEAPAHAPRYFTVPEYAVLDAITRRLVPQPARAHPVRIAEAIDARIAAGTGKGWRFDTLPADGEAYRWAIALLADAAQQRVGAPFTALDATQQDALLRELQRGVLVVDPALSLAQSRVFEDVLAECAEIYFADPIAQERFGYVGMADAKGFTRVGLNEHERYEPQRTNVNADVGAAPSRHVRE